MPKPQIDYQQAKILTPSMKKKKIHQKIMYIRAVWWEGRLVEWGWSMEKEWGWLASGDCSWEREGMERDWVWDRGRVWEKGEREKGSERESEIEGEREKGRVRIWEMTGNVSQQRRERDQFGFWVLGRNSAGRGKIQKRARKGVLGAL